MTSLRGLGLFVLLAGLAIAISLRLASGDRSEPTEEKPQSAQRVVLFAPNLTETAYLLGHADRIVGVTDFCVWPADLLERPRVGGAIDPNLERIAALGADLLVVQGEAVALREFASSQGIRLAQVKMDDDVDSILRGIAELDSVLGSDGSRARELIAETRARLDEISALPTDAGRPRVLISLGHEPESLDGLYAVGGGGFLGELVSIAGGRNIFAAHPRTYFLMSLETLVAEAPDIVLELRPGESVSADDRVALRELWNRLLRPAPRVAVIDFDGSMIPGPRIVETARIFRESIHPDS